MHLWKHVALPWIHNADSGVAGSHVLGHGDPSRGRKANGILKNTKTKEQHMKGNKF